MNLVVFEMDLINDLMWWFDMWWFMVEEICDSVFMVNNSLNVELMYGLLIYIDIFVEVKVG